MPSGGAPVAGSGDGTAGTRRDRRWCRWSFIVDRDSPRFSLAPQQSALGACLGRLVAAQQRRARPSAVENRERPREAVAVRHRKIACQRTDFHHERARAYRTS
jgi:hypothetical protein